jgi:hypothetical protein
MTSFKAEASANTVPILILYSAPGKPSSEHGITGAGISSLAGIMPEYQRDLSRMRTGCVKFLIGTPER